MDIYKMHACQAHTFTSKSKRIKFREKEPKTRRKTRRGRTWRINGERMKKYEKVEGEKARERTQKEE